MILLFSLLTPGHVASIEVTGDYNCAFTKWEFDCNSLRVQLPHLLI